MELKDFNKFDWMSLSKEERFDKLSELSSAILEQNKIEAKDEAEYHVGDVVVVTYPKNKHIVGVTEIHDITDVEFDEGCPFYTTRRIIVNEDKPNITEPVISTTYFNQGSHYRISREAYDEIMVNVRDMQGQIRTAIAGTVGYIKKYLL